MRAGSSGEHAARNAAELDVLRALCDNQTSAKERMALCLALTQYEFSEAEHQVLFDSVRVLLDRDRLSMELLTLNLIKRGFPDTELDRYFVTDAPSIGEAQDRIGKFAYAKNSNSKR